jgi:hypothetical protein
LPAKRRADRWYIHSQQQGFVKTQGTTKPSKACI